MLVALLVVQQHLASGGLFGQFGGQGTVDGAGQRGGQFQQGQGTAGVAPGQAE